MKKQILLLLIFITIFTGHILCQNENVIPVQVKEKFPDITLTSGDGKLINIPKSGRNTMLIFIRGKVTPNVWCPICHYQYLEMVEATNKTNLIKKHDLDIYFVMPYLTDSLQNWIDAFPASLKIIDGWKNPPDQENLTQPAREWMEYTQEFFPQDYEFNPDNFSLELPVLFDPDQKVSKGLFLYKHEWGGTKVEQNVPTIFIIDKNGKVNFKYFSQYTNDRPDADYLFKYIKKNL